MQLVVVLMKYLGTASFIGLDRILVNKMRYSLFFLCFILSGCWYSNGCFYTPQMVNFVDKGKLWPTIAYYQKKQ